MSSIFSTLPTERGAAYGKPPTSCTITGGIALLLGGDWAKCCLTAVRQTLPSDGLLVFNGASTIQPSPNLLRRRHGRHETLCGHGLQSGLGLLPAENWRGWHESRSARLWNVCVCAVSFIQCQYPVITIKNRCPHRLHRIELALPVTRFGGYCSVQRGVR